MNGFMSILNNQWVIGIGVTLISTLIIWIISTYISRRIVKKTNLEANNSVLDKLRPIYQDFIIPEVWFIEEVIDSVAREKGLEKSELNSVTNFLTDILVEISSNYYIPLNIKKEYIAAFELVLSDRKESQNDTFDLTLTKNYRAHNTYTDRRLHAYSRMIFLLIYFVLTGIVIIFLTTTQEVTGMQILLDDPSIELMGILIITTSLTLMLGLITFLYSRPLGKKRMQESVRQSDEPYR